MGRLAQNGVAVLVIFSKLPEITGICDRIMVMRGEHIQSEVGVALTMVAVSWFILRRTVLRVRFTTSAAIPTQRACGHQGLGGTAVRLQFSGMPAGLAGVMSAARTMLANGAQLGIGYELDAIAAVILGGTSFVGGIRTIF